MHIKPMEWLFLFLVVLVSNSRICRSQVAKKDSLSQGSGAYYFLLLEYPIINLTSINDHLEKHSYTPASLNIVAPGFGLKYSSNNNSFEFDYCSFSNKVKEENSITKTRYRSFSLNYEYRFWIIGHNSIGLLVGYKNQKLRYSFNEVNTTAQSLDQHLDDNLRYIELNNALRCLNMGVSLTNKSFVYLNIKAGLLVPIYQQGWETINSKVISGPSKIPNPFYISFSIGVAIADDYKKSY